jgi:pimeloyl-ACP methyl ester carboxylesterase
VEQAVVKRIAMIVLGVLLVVLIGAAAWLYAPDRPRAALEARHAAPPSEFRELSGLRLHLRDTGPRDAPAVLLLHGFGASLHTWDDWAATLSERFRVIRLDLPGFGLTGPDPTGDYSDPRTMAILLKVMDDLGLSRVSLVGSSMGGRIAWRFAAQFPARVDRLVLMAPDGFASPGRAYGEVPKVPMMMRVLPYVLPMPMLRASAAAAYADPKALTEPVLERYRDMLLAPGVRQAILDRTGQHVLVDPVPLLRGIRAPTLLVWGEKDRMVPVTNAADYERALPDSRLVVFPDIGHVPQEEAPARTLEPVAAFLAEGR